jgi:hypothetical protein
VLRLPQSVSGRRGNLEQIRPLYVSPAGLARIRVEITE